MRHWLRLTTRGKCGSITCFASHYNIYLAETLKLRKVAISDTCKVLLLAYLFPPSNSVGAQRPNRMAKYLPLYGVEPYVICKKPDEPEVLSPLDRIFYVPSVETQQSAVGRLADFLLPPSEVWIPNWCFHALVLAETLIRLEHIGVALSSGGPLQVHFVARSLKQKYGIKWIAELRDPLVTNPVFPKSRSGEVKDMEELISRDADAIIVTTDATASDFLDRHPETAGRMHVVWNGFDPGEHVNLRESTALRPPGRPLVVAHVGAIYSNRSPEIFLSSCVRLLEESLLRSNEILVRLMGPSEDRPDTYGGAVAEVLLEKKCLTIDKRWLSRSNALLEVQRADVLLVLDLVHLGGRCLAVPAKLYECLYTGKPILAITQRNSPVDQILAKCATAYSCLYESDSESAIDAKVLSLIRMVSEPKLPNDWFTNTFDGKKQTAQVGSIIRSVLNSASPSKGSGEAM